MSGGCLFEGICFSLLLLLWLSPLLLMLMLMPVNFCFFLNYGKNDDELNTAKVQRESMYFPCFSNFKLLSLDSHFHTLKYGIPQSHFLRIDGCGNNIFQKILNTEFGR